MKIGTLYSYWGNEWQCEYFNTAKKVAEAGCEILEVGAPHVANMKEAQLDKLKAAAKEYNLQLTVNIGPPKDKDIASCVPEIRNSGIKYLCDIMKNMDRLDSRVFVGAMYSYWPCDFTDTDKPGNWGRSVESMRKVGGVAKELGICCCMEVLNRYETYLINTCSEGLQYINDVDSKNIKLLLDIYHMNIEEDDMVAAFYMAGDKLGHIHAGEQNRRLPGTAKGIPWAEIGEALRNIGYKGGIVMEPFLLKGGSVGSDIKVWRDLSNGADEAAMDNCLKEAVHFLRTNFVK